MLSGGDKIYIKGRCIGGCLDTIRDLIGTKYDNIKNYIKNYKDDGIIWFLESFEVNTPEQFRTLWQMKNAGYFENCKGIVFGRSLIVREDYDISYINASLDALKEYDFPIIFGADIGHVAPQIPIINGSILEVNSENGKGWMRSIFY